MAEVETALAQVGPAPSGPATGHSSQRNQVGNIGPPPSTVKRLPLPRPRRFNCFPLPRQRWTALHRTVRSSGPQQSTDPFPNVQSKRLARIPRNLRPPTPALVATARGDNCRRPGWHLAGAFGIWVIIRDNAGHEVTRIEVPDGGSVTIQSSLDGGRPKRTTPVGNAPPLAIAPFDAKQARAHQEAWAQHLARRLKPPTASAPS